MQRRMHNVLNAVNHHRRIDVDDVEDTFDSKHVLTTRLQQHAQPDSESGPVQRLFERQRKRGNPFIVPIDIMPVRPCHLDVTGRSLAGVIVLSVPSL